MSMIGRIGPQTISGLLLDLELHQRSGRLTLLSSGAQAVVFVREGITVRASLRGEGTRLGRILVSEKLVSPQLLDEALKRQRASLKRRRLGEILMTMKALDHRQLAKALRRQAQIVLERVVEWSEGVYRFEELVPSRNDADGLEEAEATPRPSLAPALA